MSIKSFSELGDIYAKDVLLSEANKNDELQNPKKDKVGKVQEIGEVKLTKEGGDEKVKNQLQKPVETSKKKEKTGALTDVEKLSQPKVHKESTTMKSKFDQICSRILKEDENMDVLHDDRNDGLEDELNDETPEGGDKVETDIEAEEVNPAEVVKQLCELVDKLKTHFGISDDEETAEVAQEAVDAEVLGTPLEGDLAGAKKLQDKNNKVDGSLKNVSAKKADAKVTTGTGELQSAEEGKKLAGNKDNKVKASGPVTGKNAPAFES